jgi:Stage II sporulation protein E (SpoIIE)
VVTVRETRRLAGVSAGRALGRRWHHAVRRLRESQLVPMLLLCAASLVAGAVLIATARSGFTGLPITVFVVPMVIGNLVLGPRTLPWALVFILAVLVVVVAATPQLLDGRRIGGVLVSFVVGLVILVSSFRRTSLGVAGVRGETMLVDLRDRINNQARMPRLPEDWYAESVMRSAGGSSFAGDFIVGSVSHERSLQVAVVDVSGKGEQAGSRSLLLSGAFGGLLGALPPERFLPAANHYLLRQDWSEGFATAVHLSLDLDTGDFELRSAGHPPGVQLSAGTGRWVVHEAEGPVLGLMADAQFTAVTGRLQRGDVLLLFTDGLVETPHRDISLGIDKLIGQAEQLLLSGFETGAERLIDRVESRNDDRALLLLARR